MKSARFSLERLLALFQEITVATLAQLKAALGTAVDVTVFRKLSALPYRTSYSHRGGYYTLDTLARYDELGLWSYHDIHFSRHGTLLNTAAALVSNLAGDPYTHAAGGVLHDGHQRGDRPRNRRRGYHPSRDLGGVDHAS